MPGNERGFGCPCAQRLRQVVATSGSRDVGVKWLRRSMSCGAIVVVFISKAERAVPELVDRIVDPIRRKSEPADPIPSGATVCLHVVDQHQGGDVQTSEQRLGSDRCLHTVSTSGQ